MKNVILLLTTFLCLFFARCAPPQVDLEKEKQALLALHEADRTNHFKADAEALLASQGDEVVSVKDGKVTLVEKAKKKGFFLAYFKDAKYMEWDNLEPPTVRVSPDGKMAWMVVRVKVSRTQSDSTGTEVPTRFIYSGLTTYEKKDGRWQATANASTFMDYAAE